MGADGLGLRVTTNSGGIQPIADSGFYCREAVEAYEECNVRFVVSARKTTG